MLEALKPGEGKARSYRTVSAKKREIQPLPELHQSPAILLHRRPTTKQPELAPRLLE
jgi:hypothetical protein